MAHYRTDKRKCCSTIFSGGELNHCCSGVAAGDLFHVPSWRVGHPENLGIVIVKSKLDFGTKYENIPSLGNLIEL